MQAQELLHNFYHPVNIILKKIILVLQKKNHPKLQQPFHSSLYDSHKPKLPKVARTTNKTTVTENSRRTSLPPGHDERADMCVWVKKQEMMKGAQCVWMKVRERGKYKGTTRPPASEDRKHGDFDNFLQGGGKNKTNEQKSMH